MLKELIVDSFAGGGGTSIGLCMAFNRQVDIAINHDPSAISMHTVNHPFTRHYCESVWDVNPRKAVKGNPVALAWFSPDCKHFSKSKGGKPRDRNVRGLAWVAVRWAASVRPRVIILENVEEFQTWGPLLPNGYPEQNRIGETFTRFVNSLKKYGYKVDWRELRASDYGAPTSRKRFFLIARCDGQEIVWPQPTHGYLDGLEVAMGVLKPWRTASEIIDWEIPCPSIFTRKKPLRPKTLRRIARGIEKFVIGKEEPFIIPVKNNESDRSELVTSFMISYYSETKENEVRGFDLRDPLHTITTANRFALVNCKLKEVADENEGSFVGAFLMKFYKNEVGQDLRTPLHTVTTVGHFALVIVHGKKYQITDICMRMLTPKELFAAQGFPADYIIDIGIDGNPYPKNEQVARCGNSVPPVFAKVLAQANLPELCNDFELERVV